MLDFEYHRTDRRTLLRHGVAALAASGMLPTMLAAADESQRQPSVTEAEVRDYLRSLLLTREDVEQWLTEQSFPFCKYDAELGYLHIDRDFPEGLDGAVCRYRYDELGARRMFAHAGEVPMAAARPQTAGLRGLRDCRMRAPVTVVRFNARQASSFRAKHVHFSVNISVSRASIECWR